MISVPFRFLQTAGRTLYQTEATGSTVELPMAFGFQSKCDSITWHETSQLGEMIPQTAECTAKQASRELYLKCAEGGDIVSGILKCFRLVEGPACGEWLAFDGACVLLKKDCVMWGVMARRKSDGWERPSNTLYFQNFKKDSVLEQTPANHR